MTAESLRNYSVGELNSAIANLLDRGFDPRFLLHASVSKVQLKKGHLWLTLTDGESSITGVVWASRLNKINFRPKELDGVIVVGKINFWKSRATITVQVLDIRPSLSTVIRKFELVREVLIQDGIIDEKRRKKLPSFPNAIGILTSIPSSALSDILRTAKERWPLTRLVLISIPVQGQVEEDVSSVIKALKYKYTTLGLDALVIARGGGSREDLTLFDNELLCRAIAEIPIPVVTGIGHEDDITVADLVSDYRAATPTAAIVALLPSREVILEQCMNMKNKFRDILITLINGQRQILIDKRRELDLLSPINFIKIQRERLIEKSNLLNAFSPDRWLAKGFSFIRNDLGKPIKSIYELKEKQMLTIELLDGEIKAEVKVIHYNGDFCEKT